MPGITIHRRTLGSINDRGRGLLLASLLLLTLGTWALTIYQARTMDMPMGIVVRGATGVEEPSSADEAMVAMPGMSADDASSGAMAGMANASMGGMSSMGWGWEALLMFIVAWTVMMAAMMFPSVSPVLLLVHRVTSKHATGAPGIVPAWVFAAGYLLVWALIGIVTWVAIQLLSDLATGMSDARRETWAPIALGSVLIGAGLYQFSPLKGACLRQCQSPVGFVMTHWRNGTFGALRMGFVHGAYCLGCCWALFAVLVATGVMSLSWMLLLTLVVSVEKMGLLGPQVPRVIGVAFVTLGALVAAGTGPLTWMP